MKNEIIKIIKKNNELLKYIFVGVCTTFISIVTYYILLFTILNENIIIHIQIANIVSWICSVSFAYITNRIYVFKSKDKHIFMEAIKFFASRVSTLLVDMFMIYIFVSLVGINAKISKLLVQTIILVLNYVLSKLLVFKNKK